MISKTPPPTKQRWQSGYINPYAYKNGNAIKPPVKSTPKKKNATVPGEFDRQKDIKGI